VIRISPHLLSLFLIFIRPPWIFLIKSGTHIRPGNIPSVITHAIAVYTSGFVIVSDSAVIPRALAVVVAAGSSYVIAPITLRRSHGNGSPRNLDRVITPRRIDTAGANVKTAVEMMVFLICFMSIPSVFPLLYALTRKNTDCAITKMMTSPARINRNVLFGSNIVSLHSHSLLFTTARQTRLLCSAH